MTTWVRRRLSERRNDERGAILVLSALFLIVMVLAAALAIDIGLEGVDKRSDHRVADLASLDGARALNDTVLPCVDAVRFAAATLAANQSALRNGFNPLASGNRLTLDVGTWDPAAKTYTPVDPGVACTANAVHVVVNSVTHFEFQPMTQTLSAEAYAVQNLGIVPTPPPPPPPPPTGTSEGGFSVGSFLATITSSQAALLNEVVCQALTGQQLPNIGALAVNCPKFNLSAASWQGLANTSVTMDELGKALAANGAIGSPDQVGGATVQADKLFQATGDALTQKGDTGHAQVMYNLAQGVSGSRSVSIPKLVSQQGAQGSAFAATQPVNVANLVIGSATAQIANGQNALAVIDTGLSVPGVSSSGLNLAVIQAPQSYYGPWASPQITTSQLSNTTATKSGLNLQLNNLPIGIPGLSGISLSGGMAVALTGAGATAEMPAGVCGTSIDTKVALNPYHTSVTGGTLTLNVPLSAPLSVSITAAQDVSGGSPATHTFSFPTAFSDPGNPGADNPWHTGSTSLRFDQLQYTITVNGTIPLGTTLQTIQQQIATTVNSTIAQFDAPLNTVFRELGIAVGGADVWATQLTNLDANGNALPCSSSTTTSIPTTTTTTPAQAAPVLVK
jgi:uncharacterized membrane protein